MFSGMRRMNSICSFSGGTNWPLWSSALMVKKAGNFFLFFLVLNVHAGVGALFG